MTLTEAKETFIEGAKVRDRFKSNDNEGYVLSVLKTVIRVQYPKDAFYTTYDWAHVRICLSKV